MLKGAFKAQMICNKITHLPASYGLVYDIPKVSVCYNIISINALLNYMFSKILLAVDGSDNSFRALDAALLLSQKLGSNITAIHVIEVAPVVHVQSEKLLRDLAEEYEKEGQHIISKCSDIATKRGLLINSRLLTGDASSVILDFCEKEKHDLIVMGSRGMGKFKELVLGSVSSKVIHHSSCAVMIIR